MQKGFALLPILVISIVVIIGVSVFWKRNVEWRVNNQKNDEILPSYNKEGPPNYPFASAPSWEMYNNTKYKFSFEYPSKWHLFGSDAGRELEESIEQESVIYLTPEEKLPTPGSGEYIFVRVFENPKHLNSNEAAIEVFSGREYNLKEIKFGDVDASLLELDKLKNNRYVVYASYDNIFHFDLLNLKDDRADEIFEKIKSSFDLQGRSGFSPKLKTFESANLGVKFTYQGNIEIKEEGNMIRLNLWGPTQKAATEYYDGINITFIKNKLNGKTLEQVIREEMGKTLQNGLESQNFEPAILAGKKGFRYTMTGYGEVEATYLPIGDSSYLVIFDGTADPNNKGFKQTAKQILSSLTIQN